MTESEAVRLLYELYCDLNSLKKGQCPRCGKNAGIDDPKNRHASGHAMAYICATCKQDEIKRVFDANAQPMSYKDWHIVRVIEGKEHGDADTYAKKKVREATKNEAEQGI